MLLTALMALQLTLGIGEERQSNIHRTWAPRWDVYMVQIELGPLVANVAHKRGVAKLNPDRKFPTASIGLQRLLLETGPVQWKGSVRAYVDFGHIQGDDGASWSPAAGLWPEVPVYGPLWLMGGMYLRGPPKRERRGEQSWFRAELLLAWRWK